MTYAARNLVEMSVFRPKIRYNSRVDRRFISDFLWEKGSFLDNEAETVGFSSSLLIITKQRNFTSEIFLFLAKTERDETSELLQHVYRVRAFNWFCREDISTLRRRVKCFLLRMGIDE